MDRYTIRTFNQDFPDDDACLGFVKDLVYPDGIICRTCNEVRPHARLSNRKAYSCDYCGTHVYPLAGTIFEKSSTSLKSWFYAMFLISSTRCGISAKQLERELGVTYKPAWRMFNQIRKLMGDDTGMLGGEVEMDETYVGGKEKGVMGRPGRNSKKVPVFGIVERGGKVAALVTKDVTRATVMPIILSKVLPRSLIYTDDYRVYNPLKASGFGHKRIAHSQKVYVMGNIHTNTIEGFWSLLKRSISGVYHSVSAKHLQDYVNEFTFRYNHRADQRAMFRTVGRNVRGVRSGRYGRYAPIR
ncbi:MAG: IS1595 family transposase [Dehalococcoidia bacterium]|nr:IS1595 family transposase [Dehalococcoidia bacterium]